MKVEVNYKKLKSISREIGWYNLHLAELREKWELFKDEEAHRDLIAEAIKHCHQKINRLDSQANLVILNVLQD